MKYDEEYIIREINRISSEFNYRTYNSEFYDFN